MTQDQRDRFTDLLFFVTFERYGEKVLSDAELEELAAFGKMHPAYQQQIDNWRNGFTFDGQKIGDAVKEHASHMETMERVTDKLLQERNIMRPQQKKKPL